MSVHIMNETYSVTETLRLKTLKTMGNARNEDYSKLGRDLQSHSVKKLLRCGSTL
jgi:hypothetical protein